MTVCYVNTYKQTRVVFLEVVKKGRKYLHGITLFVDNEGEIKQGHPTQYEMEKATIYSGIRQDLREKEKEYEASLKTWHNKRRIYDQDVDRELRIVKEGKMDAWRMQNPQPTPPDLGRGG